MFAVVPLTGVYAINPTLQQERIIQRENRQATGTQLRKDRALQEIDRRIAALNKVLMHIIGIKKLTDVQKSTLTTQVQDEIAVLQNLRVKIGADSDPVQLQADKKSIVDSYRIFALFIPKIDIIVHADRIMYMANLMADKTKDQSLFLKITDAKTKSQNAINTVLPLAPDGYPGNKTSLQSARTLLREALKELNDVRKSMKSNSSNSSSSSSSSI